MENCVKERRDTYVKHMHIHKYIKVATLTNVTTIFFEYEMRILQNIYINLQSLVVIEQLSLIYLIKNPPLDFSKFFMASSSNLYLKIIAESPARKA